MNIKSRSAAIVIHNNSILLMYRQKAGKEYYVFPGGSIEPNEDPKDAAIREVFEETTVVVNSPRLVCHLNIDYKNYKEEFFFLCNYVSGSPFLISDSEEYKRMTAENYYEPMWVKISDLKDICLYPLEIRDLLIADQISS